MSCIVLCIQIKKCVGGTKSFQIDWFSLYFHSNKILDRMTMKTETEWSSAKILQRQVWVKSDFKSRRTDDWWGNHVPFTRIARLKPRASAVEGRIVSTIRCFKIFKSERQELIKYKMQRVRSYIVWSQIKLKSVRNRLLKSFLRLINAMHAQRLEVVQSTHI